MDDDKPRRSTPRIAGAPLRLLSRAIGTPLVERFLGPMLLQQMGLRALDAVRFDEEDAPFGLPATARPIDRRPRAKRRAAAAKKPISRTVAS